MTRPPVRRLSIPDLPDDCTPRAAALAYARCGWYVVPSRPDDLKNPGSILGKRWPSLSTREPEVIRRYWPSGCARGVEFHVGRSGAVVFDVDHPHALPRVLRKAVAATAPPFQSTRTNEPGKGHYVFAVPPGRSFGNSTGGLGDGWGEVRGRNGVILVEPSAHPDAEHGGDYWWEAVGEVPVLPASVAAELSEAKASVRSASAVAVAEFIAAHNTGNPRRLRGILAKLDRQIAAGASRHDATLGVLVWAMKEANAGILPAEPAVREIVKRFQGAFEADER